MTAAAGLLVMIHSPEAAAAKDAPKTWDGLVQVKSKKLDLVYLQPNADFRGYTKVIVDPTEVGFAKNWLRDHNRSHPSISGRISEKELQAVVAEAAQIANEIFAEAWREGGYTIAIEPGPDAIRVKTGVIDIRVTAPENDTAGRTYSFSNEAGSATLFIEARDSVTGALLGRAVDQAIVGDSFTTWRTASSNRDDFRRQVATWAKISVRGLSELKSLSPLAP